MLSAWYGGLGPGLLTTVVGGFVGLRALVGTGADSTPLSASVVTRLGVFMLEALVICVVCGLLRRTESRAQALAASEQGARLALERAAHQIRAVQRVTDTALTHLRLDDLLPELLGRVREAMAADTVVILLLNEERTELAVRGAHGLEDEVKLDMRIPFGRGIAGSIAARGTTMVIEDVSQAEVVSPILRAKGLHTLLGTPLVLDGRGIGVVHVGSLSPRRFTPEALGVLQQHRWRGNIRELKNTVERVLIMARGDIVDVADVRQFLRVDGPSVASAPAASAAPAVPVAPTMAAPPTPAGQDEVGCLGLS